MPALGLTAGHGWAQGEAETHLRLHTLPKAKSWEEEEEEEEGEEEENVSGQEQG